MSYADNRFIKIIYENRQWHWNSWKEIKSERERKISLKFIKILEMKVYSVSNTIHRKLNTIHSVNIYQANWISTTYIKNKFQNELKP